jgi:hypothetical protein
VLGISHAVHVERNPADLFGPVPIILSAPAGFPFDEKSYVVWPKSQAQREAVLPLPKGTTFSSQ